MADEAVPGEEIVVNTIEEFEVELPSGERIRFPKGEFLISRELAEAAARYFLSAKRLIG